MRGPSRQRSGDRRGQRALPRRLIMAGPIRPVSSRYRAVPRCQFTTGKDALGRVHPELDPDLRYDALPGGRDGGAHHRGPGLPQEALGPPLTAGWLRRPAFVRKRARARTKAHRFLIPRSAGCLPKRDVARPAGSRLLGFSLEGRLPRLGRHGGRTARRTRNRLYSALRTSASGSVFCGY
jgi:hypothetical protein